ncbi:deoxyribonuclease II [Cavenderia fasciculata]|uniref:Deoxyribonuclease II n=1 Tax=Cavenderia fasciculata TaxID=261658 RepID=F4PW99_CACFS|nr:deoxyribonuclease II [Cavenderia fasciculata]EGG20263.1 deoxyribonuclease II [Cavenderia fasciculata]|eukprot:XP_004367246.1 deoxyribonuclease II [Cavenderia fasciculata]
MSKQPSLNTSPSGTRFRYGLGYAYADVSKQSLEISSNWLNETTALSHTLNQIYKHYQQDGESVSSSSSVPVWLMYNDQPPIYKHYSAENQVYEFDFEDLPEDLLEEMFGSVSSDYAHSKGSLAFNDDHGFWLIHSTPRFPWDAKSYPYQYPSNEVKNGQSYLCVSYNADQFDSIIKMLYVNRAYVYTYDVPTETKLPMTELKNLLSGGFEASPTATSKVLTSSAKTEVTVFAKNKQWYSDLYEDLLQPTIQQNMIVTTWRIGSNSSVMPSFCPPQYKYDSINTVQLTISEGTDNVMTWKYTKDHSKWAISMPDEPTFYVCIGDINKTYSQYNRGGGTACIVSKTLWESYYAMVAAMNGCPTTD